MFGATMLFSLLLHGVLILGIGFTYVKSRPSLPTLDITLVDVANREAPDKADFLAQANNSGGGESDKAARPSQPVSGPLPTPTPGVAPQRVQASAPRPQAATPDKLLTTTGNSHYTVNSDTAKLEQTQEQTDAAAEAKIKLEMAQLAAERRNSMENYAKRPKKKFISSNTKEYAYAAYMRGWVDRVERIGNLNYPNEARRRGLHGDVLMTVTLNRDGSVKSIDIVQSSGQPLLDAAAQRIVRLSAPFPAIPEDKDRIDELNITRTWQFMPNDVLRSR